MFGPPRSRHMKANIVPPGSAQSAPARPRGAFGGPPRRRSGWDALKILGATMQDLDGSTGYGHRDLAMQGIRDRRTLAQNEAQKAQFGKVLENMGLPGVADLNPEQMSFLYGMKRDQVADAKDLRNFNAGRDDRKADVAHRDRVFDAGRSDRAEDVTFRENRADASDEQWLTSFNQDVLESDRSYDLANEQFSHSRAMDYANLDLATHKAEQSASGAGYRPATPEELAAYGYNPETTTAQVGPQGQFKVVKEQKPMISSENMARVASNLPNLKRASDNLTELFTTKQGKGITGFAAPEKGYRPGHDWGAQAISAIPDFGLLEGLAKTVGGKDYQTYETEYSAFEAAALPIVSGSAVSESEAKRFLNSIKVQMGDSDEIVARKLEAKQNFVKGLEAAATGDSGLLQELVSGKTSNVPEIGVVENGYRFKGGDPADPANWERV